ncbi:unnamed protein product [Linum trigynum]|uniref:Uncharacterized protein n=1 Tax=Linum trigynum TaxID=586398 RepID=A0AAV2DYT6_9ROSI
MWVNKDLRENREARDRPGRSFDNDRSSLAQPEDSSQSRHQIHQQEAPIPRTRTEGEKIKRDKSPRGFALKKLPKVFVKRGLQRSPPTKDKERRESSRSGSMGAAHRTGQIHGRFRDNGLSFSARPVKINLYGDAQCPNKKLVWLRDKEAQGLSSTGTMAGDASRAARVEKQSDGEATRFDRPNEITRRRQLILEDDSDDDF